MIPLNVRKDLWAWYYGMRAFEHCKASCDYILKERMTSEHPLYYSLNVAATISYGKPFRASRGLERLPEDIIPPAYRHAHNQIMHYRDKVFAHTDTNENLSAADRLFDVIFSFDKRGEYQFAKGFKVLESSVLIIGVERISALTDLLIVKARYHMDKILKRYAADFPKVPGEYRIGIGPNEPHFTKL
jgi:hypothetical protein